MKMRFRIKPRGQKSRTLTVNVPGRSVRRTITGYQGGALIFAREIEADFIAAFEARHSAEVLEIRRPARRARA